LSQIGKSFSGIAVLKNVSFDLYPGEVHCLVGENGAGKSTLIKIISGAYSLDEGAISYMGQPVHGVTPRWAREHGIMTIYQEIDLIPSLNAVENIFLGNELLKRSGNLDWATARRKAQAILEDIGAHIDLQLPVGKLKLAHQQMVAIAKALSLKSKVIILDEPTAVFTSSEVHLLFNMLHRLKAQEIAVIYISHHLDEIFEIGDRVTVLRDGNWILTDRLANLDKATLIKAMIGRDIDFAHRNGKQDGFGEEALRVESLTKAGVLKNISFSVRRGEVVGMAGLVGAGRSEVARAIIGAMPVDSGKVFIHGAQTQVGSPGHALQLGMGMLPESRKEDGLVLVRTIAENMGFSLVASSARLSLVPWRKVGERVKGIIQELNVRPPQPNLQVRYLSGGNQQKVVLGKWLAAASDILILDEPTRGVDVGARAEIYKFMQELKKDGKAILMISSDMTEILTQSDRILVMAGGKIVGELSGADATEEKVLSLALEFGETVP
jgi:ribose transport system ATP-binding protein